MVETRIISGRGDLADAFALREAVFTKEQGFADPDSDSWDPVSTHLVLYVDGRPAATGRIYRDEAEAGTFHIGRLCVLKEFRGLHLGQQALEALEQEAVRQGARRLALGAQLYAIPFYEKSGFVPSGERYLDEFCMHEMLYKDV